MWWIFIILYFSYLFLGPHWERKVLLGQKLDIVKDTRELLRRSVFISYVSLLYTAWFLYTRSYSAFINAALLSLLSTIAYIDAYGPEDTIPSHIILNIFVLIMGSNILDLQTNLTFLLLLFYLVMKKNIYKN
jgi:hypothetical protein